MKNNHDIINLSNQQNNEVLSPSKLIENKFLELDKQICELYNFNEINLMMNPVSCSSTKNKESLIKVMEILIEFKNVAFNDIEGKIRNVKNPFKEMFGDSFNENAVVL